MQHGRVPYQSFIGKVLIFTATLWCLDNPRVVGAQTVEDAITSGSAWLLSVRYGMAQWGLLAPLDPQAEFSSDDFSRTYLRDSVEAIGALQAVNAALGDYENSVRWLQISSIPSTGLLATKIRVIAQANLNVSEDLDRLLSYRNSDSGFGGAKGYPSNISDTALTLQGLTVAHNTDTATIISGAVSYLLSTQNPDGGWGFVKGQTSHVYYTALVMQALETQVQTAAIANALSRGTAYLLAQQQSDGSFGEGGGNVPDTALAFMAIARTTGNVEVRSAAVRYLLSQQLPDGSWNDDPYATALVLQALHLGSLFERQLDNDADGFTESQGDCNDADATVYPGAPDLTVDGIDQDCNGIDGPPAGNVDTDADGFTVAQGDCNESNPMIYPGAIDIPGNGIDENCDGQDGATVVDIQSVSLFKLINGLEVPASAFGPYETVNIHVVINDPSVPLSLFVTDANGAVFDVRSESGGNFFDTVNHFAGNYTVTVRALDAGTGVILDEATAPFTIQSGEAILGGLLAIIPAFTHVGATETEILAVSLNNGSNIPVSVTIQHEVHSPSGALLSSGAKNLSILPEEETADVTLATFSYTFAEDGSYPIVVQVFNGQTLLAALTGTISVAGNIRIDPSITVTPGTVLPDGDKRIHIDIHLEGVEQTP